MATPTHATRRATETTIWCGYRFVLPCDWELLQFRRNPDEGSCAWADRHRFRFQVQWKRIEEEPRMERLMSGYLEGVRDEATHLTERRIGDWRGFEGRENGLLITRMFRYFPEAGSLIEAIFLDPRESASDGAFKQEILAGIAWEPDADRWKAFGMDLRAPAGFPLTRCSVQPAAAEWTFAPEEESPVFEKFERFGMTRHWLWQSLAEWLPAHVTPKGRHAKTECSHYSDHTVYRLESRSPRRLGRRRLRLVAEAWMCPEDGRLYCCSVSQKTGRKGDPAPGRLAGERLSCCDRLHWNAGGFR